MGRLALARFRWRNGGCASSALTGTSLGSYAPSSRRCCKTARLESYFSKDCLAPQHCDIAERAVAHSSGKDASSFRSSSSLGHSGVAIGFLSV